MAVAYHAGRDGIYVGDVIAAEPAGLVLAGSPLLRGALRGSRVGPNDPEDSRESD